MRVELQGVGKRFGKVVALDGISMTLLPGQRVALIGPNGAGKSTLTRVIMGMLACEGRVTLDGHSPYEDRVRLARHLAYVPQIPPRLGATVGELLHAIARLRGLDPLRIEVTCGRLRLDVQGLKKQPFRNLSGGMRQKLLLALALSSSAKLLILDEPTASLDVKARQRFFRLVEELEEKPTMLLCSHRLEEIRHLVDQVVVLEEGQVRWQGSSQEFLGRRPHSAVEVLLQEGAGTEYLLELGFCRTRDSRWWTLVTHGDQRSKVLRDLSARLGEQLEDILVRHVETLDAAGGRSEEGGS